jgi:AmmeMemoRadiSam system protein A
MMDLQLTDSEKNMLLVAARASIFAEFGEKQFLPGMLTPTLSMPCGAFVTLTKHGELRGCIGYITSEKSLYETVRDAAHAAAFQDGRFPRVRSEELSEISIEISVLSPLSKIRDVSEIQAGKHGLLLKKGYSSGLLLPQVATEYGWDRDTFLAHTCLKAGLASDCWKQSDTSIEIFTAAVFAEGETKGHGGSA